MWFIFDVLSLTSADGFNLSPFDNDRINPIIHDFVMQHTQKPVREVLPSVVSPFEEELAAAGCANLGVDDSESDSEEEFF